MVPILVALVLGSTGLVAGLPTRNSVVARADNATCTPSAGALPPAGQYCGTSTECDSNTPTMLRISNGGAGLSGLVGALANQFVDYCVQSGNGSRFKVEWIKGDTTETIGYLGTGQTDVGITYSKAAECQAVNDQVSDRREYGFRDHFYLVGPSAGGSNNSNPARLIPTSDGNKSEDILQQIQKIVRTGNLQGTPPTRFLSRYDKSATNIKDSELFIRVGQVPWALAYSKWYHEYPRYPIDALQAASLLQEYTITDRGTWLSTDKTYTDKLTIYNEGRDTDPEDPLLNPAFFLTSTKSCAQNKEMANAFLDWVVSDAGQKAVAEFKQPNSTELLYTSAPTGSNQMIKNCTVPGV
ncbi:tungstate-binding protein [Ceratobasidium sp. AG-Ba]|nr:tungstate-binding protein [Ceratobasidium sp. AG-Ba]